MRFHCLDVDFTPDSAELLRRLGLERDSGEAADCLDLLEQMRSVARPRAAFLEAGFGIDADAGQVVVGGIAFRSRLLAQNLARAAGDRIWPHIVTCGREMADFAQTLPGTLEQYWCDAFMQAALEQARAETLLWIDRECRAGKLASMNPGALPEWPIQEQRPLFRLLDAAAAFAGVELTGALIMLPVKSVSGIFFHSETDWGSCATCPRENCQNRRAGDLQK